MGKRKYSGVEMIGALKQLEAERRAAEIGLGVSKHTVYAWKAKYAGMSVGRPSGYGKTRG
jgi:putative transposase